MAYSQIIKHHETDPAIALLFSPDTQEYWIGEYSTSCAHQTPEPPYVWCAGNWTSLDEATLSLTLWTY